MTPSKRTVTNLDQQRAPPSAMLVSLPCLVLLTQAGCGRFSVYSQVPPAGDAALGDGDGAGDSAGDVARPVALALHTRPVLQVGLCLPLTVERQVAGVPDAAPTELFVVLLASGATLAGDPLCSQQAASVTLRSGNSSASLFIRATAAGQVTVQAQSLAAAAASLTIAAVEQAESAAVALALSGPAVIPPNRCVPYVIGLRDQADYAVLASADIAVAVSDDGGGGAVHADADCLTVTATVPLTAATAMAPLWYRSLASGPATLRASAAGLSGASLELTVDGDGVTPALLVLDCPPLTTVASCTPCAVTVLDAAGRAVLLAQPLTLSLSASGGGFFADERCNQAITESTIPGGHATVAFRYQATAVGTFLLAARGATLPAGDVTIAVVPATFPPGDNCATDADCSTGHCECADVDCVARRCNPIDCDCQFDVLGDGSCDGPVAAGRHDPEASCGAVERCDGVGGCRANILFSPVGTTTLPAVTVSWSSSGLYVNGVGGDSVIAIGDWDNNYSSANVAVYDVSPDGVATFAFTFVAAANQPVGQGFADRPLFVANNFTNGGNLWLHLLDVAGRQVTTVTVDLPSGVMANASNYGSAHLSGDDFYIYEWNAGRIAHADISAGGTVGATVVLDTATAGLPGTLHEICVGVSAVYGVLNSNQLVVWDRALVQTGLVPFSPAHALSFGHYGGGETQCYVDGPFVWLLSSGHLHLINAGRYYYIGSATGLSWYELHGGWGVRDGVLRLYRTSDNGFARHAIAFE